MHRRHWLLALLCSAAGATCLSTAPSALAYRSWWGGGLMTIMARALSARLEGG